MEVIKEKKALRTHIKNEREAINKEFKLAYDTAICDKLDVLISNKNCQVVHAYIPMENEIDIRPLLAKLLAKGIKVITPKTLKNRELQHLELTSLDSLEDGIYGTSHPADAKVYSDSFDLIIVPGLAFDAKNYRLGYGGGYYDTFLAKHSHAFTVGIGYPFQKIAKVPREKHDACLDLIL